MDVASVLGELPNFELAFLLIRADQNRGSGTRILRRHQSQSLSWNRRGGFPVLGQRRHARHCDNRGQDRWCAPHREPELPEHPLSAPKPFESNALSLEMVSDLLHWDWGGKGVLRGRPHRAPAHGRLTRKGQVGAVPSLSSGPAAQLRHLAQGSPSASVLVPARPTLPLQEVLDGPDPKSILNWIGEVVYDWDIGSDRLTWGPNVADVLDFASAEDLATGRTFGNLLSALSHESRYEAIARSQDVDQASGVPYHICYALEATNSNAPRAPIWIEDTGRWFADASGKPAGAHGLIRVVTTRHKTVENLQKRSRVDPATGALNRASLTEHIEQLLERSQHRNETFVVLLAAIENLFAVNRTYGYDAADQVIAGIVARLRAEMRGSDVIARYAGNKFGLVLAGCEDEQMKVAARRFIEAIAGTPFQTNAGPVHVGLRVGGVIAPRHGRAAQILFRHAEEALDLARQAGARRFAEFEHSLSAAEARLRALRTADDILGGLNQGRIALALQPVVRLTSRG